MMRIAVVGVLLLGVTALIITNPFGSDPARAVVESVEEMAAVIDASGDDCEKMADALTPAAARFEQAAKALGAMTPQAQKKARERYKERLAKARKRLAGAVKCAMNRRVRDALVNRL